MSLRKYYWNPAFASQKKTIFALCDIIRVMISIIENNDSIEICLHQLRI